MVQIKIYMNKYFSLSHTKEQRERSKDKISTDDIKKGLQKIKVAQLQVLKELRKEPMSIIRKQSYSKDENITTSFTSSQSVSKKHDHNRLKEEIVKEKNRISTNKMDMMEKRIKENENTQQKLRKQIQQLQIRLYKNAQEGERKVRQLEDKYNKKQQKQHDNQFYKMQLKKLQNKEIKKMKSNSENYLHYLINQIEKINEVHQNLLENSTIEDRQEYEKHFNNIIVYLRNVQAGSYEQQYGYMSGTIRQDIRKIQQELEKQSKGKQQELLRISVQNTHLQSQVNRLKTSNNDLEKQNKETKTQNLLKQQTINKLNKKIGQSKYENQYLQKQIKKINNEQEKQKQKQVQKLNNINKTLKKQLQLAQVKYGELSSQLEQISLTNKQLRHQNLSIKEKHEVQVKNLSYSYLKINKQIEDFQGKSIKEKEQFQSMVEGMKKMQEERRVFRERQKQTNNKIQLFEYKIKKDYETYSQIQETLSAQIVKLRQQNKILIKSVNQMQNTNRKSTKCNEQIDELWKMKNEEYTIINHILKHNIKRK